MPIYLMIFKIWYFLIEKSSYHYLIYKLSCPIDTLCLMYILLTYILYKIHMLSITAGLERVSDSELRREMHKTVVCVFVEALRSHEKINIQSCCIRYVQTHECVWYNGSRPHRWFMVEPDELCDGVVSNYVA